LKLRIIRAGSLAQPERRSAWRESVLAADAKNAGIASEDTLSPQAPILDWKTGL